MSLLIVEGNREKRRLLKKRQKNRIMNVCNWAPGKQRERETPKKKQLRCEKGKKKLALIFGAW